MRDKFTYIFLIYKIIIKNIKNFLAKIPVGSATTVLLIPPRGKVENYHDRILSRKGQLKTMNDYIADNPRRLLIKRLYPDLFKRKRKISFNMDGMEIEMAAFGNTFLLDNILKSAVKVSSKDTVDSLRLKENDWEYVIDNDGVLISPFINRREKRWRYKAIGEGGRLLLLAPLHHDPRKERQKILKSEADPLNEIALFLTGSWRE